MKKKLIMALLVGSISLSAVACGNSSGAPETATETTVESKAESETQTESITETETESETMTETIPETEAETVPEVSYEDLGMDVPVPETWKLIKNESDEDKTSIQYTYDQSSVFIYISLYDEELAEMSDVLLGATLAGFKKDDTYSEVNTAKITVDGKSGEATMFYHQDNFYFLVTVNSGTSIVSFIYGNPTYDSDQLSQFSAMVDGTKFINSGSSDTATSTETTARDDSIPKEYLSALNKAESYSNTMHMSKASLYNQLTSEYGEKFSAEAAQYAIDNVEADWKANALEKAKDYSSTMHMSKAGVYKQLTSEYGEQFTEEEAQYAIDNVEADWKANALEKAKSYQETNNMSPEAIRDQLTSEYGEQFTAEEADYAVSNLK